MCSLLYETATFTPCDTINLSVCHHANLTVELPKIDGAHAQTNRETTENNCANTKNKADAVKSNRVEVYAEPVEVKSNRAEISIS